MRALFAACAEDATSAGRRDAALLAVLYGAGIRRAEAVAPDLADYDIATGAVTIRRGKGNKDRVGYASNGSKEALDAWLEVRGGESGLSSNDVRRHITPKLLKSLNGPGGT